MPRVSRLLPGVTRCPPRSRQRARRSGTRHRWAARVVLLATLVAIGCFVWLLAQRSEAQLSLPALEVPSKVTCRCTPEHPVDGSGITPVPGPPSASAPLMTES